jgi:hypothetical protein
VLGIHPALRQGVRVRIRTRHLQMAFLGPRAEGEAEDHLGLQDLVPRCPIPNGPKACDIR